jgi:hypothetical protein
MPSIQLDEFFLLAEEDSGQSVGRVSLSFLEVGSASAVVLSHPMMRRSITTIRSAPVLTFILLHHFNSTLCVVSRLTIFHTKMQRATSVRGAHHVAELQPQNHQRALYTS